jgi:hypothetical protein
VEDGSDAVAANVGVDFEAEGVEVLRCYSGGLFFLA